MCSPSTVDLNPEVLKNTILESTWVSQDRTPLQLLDIITNQFLFYLYAKGSSDFVHFGRHFFRPVLDRNEKTYDLAMGRMIYEGFFKSLRLVMGSPSRDNVFLTLNIDVKKAPFFKPQPLIDTVLQTLNLRGEPRHPLDREQIKLLNRHLQDLRVHTVYDKKTTFVLCSFTNVSSEQQMFNWNGRPTSVANYHETKYKARIRYPMLPCARKRGRPGEYTYFPIEVLFVVEHQKVELKKTNEDQGRQLIKVGAVPPEKRLQDVKYMARFTDESPNGEDNHFVKAFGIERSRELMRVSGRILPAPRILYNESDRNNTVEVRNGSWNVQNQKLFLPANIDKYAVVAFTNQSGLRPDMIQRFVGILAQCGRNLGLSISNNFSGDYGEDENADPLLRHLSNIGFRFVICILGEHVKGEKLRNAIKLCEVRYTIVTQCIRVRTILKAMKTPNPTNDTFRNIIYKINVKNGGVNNELQISDPIAKKWLRPGVMIVGMDVSHPPPLSKAELAQGVLPKEPSVAGIVANTGRSTSDFRMKYFLQDMRKEEISESSIVDAFTKFVDDYALNHNNARPDSIIVYRDGVSEGQYKMVVDREILAMKQAFGKMKPPAYQPKLTVLTVQKRHNTRFFQEKLENMPQDEASRMKNTEKNIPAGTVVDSGPVSAKLYDFFLCSHAGLQSTSKPAYFVVVLNENEINADELQTLTFLQCHEYQRCTKSVSVPAPCFHAHLAAARGKMNYTAFVTDNEDSSSGIGSAESSSGRSSDNPRSNYLSYDVVQRQIEYGPLMGDKMLWL
uniref:Uncharacterized protein n=1 Tax=Romanomermis culicivorax TaxID=13658 RepID=A0A915JWP9_ROMCU